MAKRKTGGKKTTHRRRRVSGMDKDILTMAAGSIAGYVVGNMVGSKIAPTMDSKIKGAAIAALGIFVVPMAMKNSLGKGLAIGLATYGGQSILKSLNVISGYDGVGVRQLPINPYTLLPATVNGRGINQQVNGGNGISNMVNGVGDGISNMVNGRRSITRQKNMRLFN